MTSKQFLEVPLIKRAMQQSTAYIREQLAGLYTASEIRFLADLLFEEMANLTRTQLILNPSQELTPNVREQIQIAVQRLAANEPIQYILGNTEFYGLTLAVNEHTLIPRPETSELIERILSMKTDVFPQNARCLDIGTGSGCIPIVLKKHCPSWRVAALDIAEGALEVARANAQANNVQVDFLQADILNAENLNFPHRFHIIVSNPPYICEAEKREMEENVLRYEPHTALFVPNEKPLLFYDAIACFALHNLVPGGYLFFEINRAYGSDTCEMLRQKGFSNVQLHKDISGNDRVVVAQFSPEK